MNFKMKGSTSLLLMVIGALILHLYLNWIRIYGVELMPIGFMWIGVIFCSISIVSLYKLSEKPEGLLYFLIGIYSFSLVLLLMPISRYHVIYGSDIIGEYAVAKKMSSLEYWPLELAETNSLMTCLSVTILPTVINKVVGLSIDAIFKFVYPILEAFVPICLFVTVKRIFKSTRIAYLSAILYAVSYWYFSFLSGMLRQQIAHIFLLLLLWSIFRESSMHTRKFRFLALFFAFGVIFSHYTVANLTATVFLAFLFAAMVSKKFVRNILKHKVNYSSTRLVNRIMSRQFLVCYIVMILGWFLFVAYPIFQSNVGLFKLIIQTILGLHKEELHVTVGYIKASPRGPLITAWFDLQYGMIAVGALYALYKFLNDIKKSSWNLGGCAILAFIGISLVVPVMTRYLPPERLVSFGYIFFVTYLAALLLRLNTFSKLKYIIVAFLLLSPTMNMLLPANEGLLLYHPENTMSTSDLILLTPTRTSDYSFGNWISSHSVSEDLIYGDIKAEIIGTMAFRQTFAVKPTRLTENKYVIFPRYAFEGMWLVHGKRQQRVTVSIENNVTSQLFGTSAVTYDNGYCMLLQRSMISENVSLGE